MPRRRKYLVNTSEVICSRCTGAGLEPYEQGAWKTAICSGCNGNGRYLLTVRKINGVESRSVQKYPFAAGVEGSEFDEILGGRNHGRLSS
jgi:hypothetical protein